jgi:hypothetical protein
MFEPIESKPARMVAWARAHQKQMIAWARAHQKPLWIALACALAFNYIVYPLGHSTNIHCDKLATDAGVILCHISDGDKPSDYLF